MNLRNVDLNLLVTLDAMLSERSISKAAGRLSVTQPALSHALRRLREVFDDPLLRRGARGMEPTERALALQGPLKALLAEIQVLLRTQATFQPKTAVRNFKISMSDAMSVEVLPIITREVRRQAPNIDLLISTSGGPRAACVRVSNDDVELAIGVYPEVPPELRRRELYRDQLICIADRKNPRLKRGRMDQKAYLASPHVTVAPNSDAAIQLDTILLASGIQRRIAAIVPHYIAVPAIVRGTDLVGHTSTRQLRMFPHSAQLASFPIPISVHAPELVFEQIWHKRYDVDAGHEWLRELVARTVGNPAK
jgi:DNA-binding transcriptional LysR family regulator